MADESAARFRDHFSSQSADYAAFRPRYPDALFDWLAAAAPSRALAWDCATGSGQAVPGIAARFDRVIATDASAAQLAHAPPRANVEYRVATAEASGLADGSAALVHVAQALHWFDQPRFWAEARRVAAPGGVVAVTSYGSAVLDTPDLAAVFARFEHETMGAYWPTERAGVGEGLRAVPFPFAELEVPPVALEVRWTLDALLGYVRSWSASARWVARHGTDPAAALAGALSPLWGDPAVARRVTWPFVVRAGVVGRAPAGSR